jgi:hypothetical protein
MPAAPHVLTIRVSDAALILAFFATIAALTGYTLGLGEANTLALRAEALAIDAEATLAQARHLCGGAP